MKIKAAKQLSLRYSAANGTPNRVGLLKSLQISWILPVHREQPSLGLAFLMNFGTTSRSPPDHHELTFR